MSALNVPQALKRGHILNNVAARVEIVPFPNPLPIEFFRSLLERARGRGPSISAE